MFRGFYTVTSSMLSESRRLDVTANNLANTSTVGFKSDELILTNFGDEMVAVMSNNLKEPIEEIGSFGTIVVESENIVNYDQGNIEQTSVITDFALLGDGFFAVENPNEEVVYTRNGSFSINDAGFLNLQGTGMVQGQNGPIQVENDRFTVDGQGNVFAEDGTFIDQLIVADFPDYDNLIKVGEGLFQSPDEPEEANPQVIWQSIEYSNVNAADELTTMMVSQRNIQSASQILKMYDQMSNLAVNQIGKV